MSTESGTPMSVLVKVDLDWSAPGHWDADHSLPCRVCSDTTQQRDNTDLPCHKHCREDEIARELLGRAYALVADERFPAPAQQGLRARTEVAR
ncbi:hypothetical protein [Mangrovihabitans endophyticus]|uniref:Uncharacterized protein n=1 Tax=Mangrovihabitans endophyticus TaxID=1751298 RepID=A0A8J3C5H0_9ACTN|nr:hypothetical protein [Mangrovihabitans endophyticus]GGL17825.1 hypothetical protein GCM10012284_60570 [Mangrovihabitans endophyticus]